MGRPNILYTAFVAQDYMTTPVAKMGASVKGLAATTSVASAKMAASLSKVSSAAMDIGFAGIAIATGIIIPLGLATKAAINFEAQMANVSTLVDTTVENMDEMGESVLRLSKKIPKPINDLTEGLYYIRSAGIGAADAMGVLEASGKLATAGLSSVEDAAKAVTTAMVTFKGQGLTTEQIANSFFLTVQEGKTKMDALNESFGSVALIAGNAGIKLQELNAATAAMTNAGFTASEAQIALRGATMALIKPTGTMVDVLAEMGYVGADAGTKLLEKMGGLVPAMIAIKDAAKGAGDNINKAFGRVQGLSLLVALTGNQNAAFNKNLAEQNSGADALTGATAKQMATADAQMKIFKNTTQILGITIGHILIPPLTKMVNIISPIIDGIVSFSHHHKILTNVIVDSIAVVGSLAATVGALGLAIGTVTRGGAIYKASLISINGIIGTYNFLTAFAAVQTGNLTGAVLKSKAGFLGARVAMGEYNMELKNAGVLSLALLANLKAISIEQDHQNEEKAVNPFGFNFSGSADDNRDKLKKYGISDDKYKQYQDVYNRKKEKNWEEKTDKDGLWGYVNDPVGAVTRAIQRRQQNKSNSGATDPTQDGLIQKNSNDSTGRAIDKFYQNLAIPDTTGQASAGYVPPGQTKFSMHVHVTTEKGLAANVTTKNNNSAPRVPIDVYSTTERT